LEFVQQQYRRVAGPGHILANGSINMIEMPMWAAIILIAVAGAVGGFGNALISDNGFLMPKRDSVNGGTILRPGFVGNAVIGALGATISWALYGPAGNRLLTDSVSPTLAAFGGAILVGVGGARWLSNEVDKSLLRAAAINAAASPTPSPKLAVELANATPAAAAQLTAKLQP
jgi:hypothetical protein